MMPTDWTVSAHQEERRRNRRRRKAHFLSDASVRELRTAFDKLDSDGDGWISAAEVRQLLLALGAPPPSNDALCAMLAAASQPSSDGKGSAPETPPVEEQAEKQLSPDASLDFEAFLTFVRQHLSLADNEQAASVQELFNVVDLDQTGQLNIDEIIHVFNNGFGMALSKDEAEAMVHFADDSGDGVLSLREFRSIYRRTVTKPQKVMASKPAPLESEDRDA